MPLIAAGIGAAANVGTQYFGGKAQKKAAKKAAAKQAAQSKANSALSNAVYNQNVGLFSPAAVQGQRSGNVLMELLLGGPAGGGGGYAPQAATAGPTLQQQYDKAMSLLGPKSRKTALKTQGTLEQKLAAALANTNPQEQQTYDAWMMEQQPSIYEAGGLGANGMGGGALDANGNPVSALSAWDQFRQGTNYNWRLGEGQRATNQGYAGAGGLESGAAQTALQEQGQNFASNELGNWMNMLANQQGIGLTSAGRIAGYGDTNYNNISGTNQQAAEAKMNQFGVQGQAAANLWGAVGQGIGNVANAAFPAGAATGAGGSSFDSAAFGRDMSRTYEALDARPFQMEQYDHPYGTLFGE